jgi:hypothetical protein
MLYEERYCTELNGYRINENVAKEVGNLRGTDE